MKAVTVVPGMAGSVRLEEVPEPDASLRQQPSHTALEPTTVQAKVASTT
jgi:hypothetical protein